MSEKRMGQELELDRNQDQNKGIPLNLPLIESRKVNRSASEHRVQTLVKRRSVKKANQAAWLIKAITCIDLTTLAGDDTPGNVRRLCAKAMQPVKRELLRELGIDELAVGAVCVYHPMINVAKVELAGSGIPIAAVSTGFPSGQITHTQKLEQIRDSVAAGANEIDIVISRTKVLLNDWKGLYQEVADFRKACGPAHLKTILATGELGTLTNVARASWVCMMAGADFIKTSTGKEPVNATLPVSLVMVRCIRDYYLKTGYKVGFKPAGGIRSAKQALEWLILLKEELGNDWLNNRLFRFGASGLLTDIERQLEHYVTGRYAASYRQPMA